MTRLLPLLLVGLVGCAPADQPAPPAKPSDRADALDLLLLAGDTPTWLELKAEIDGKSVPRRWDDVFAALTTYFDRDADGTLRKAEAAHLPSAFALRQVLWGQFTPFADDASPFDLLDLDADGKASGAEVADFYRRAGLGGVLVGVGKPPATEKLTAALLKAVDANKDGVTDEAEWTKAAETLAKVDANGDELVGPGELVSKIAYPGAVGSIMATAPQPNAKTDAICAALPLVVLPLRTADTHWTTAVAKRTGKSADDLPALRTAAPGVAWAVKLDGNPARQTHVAGGLTLELRTDAGKLTDQTAAARKLLVGLFGECDIDVDGTLSAKELAALKAIQFQQLLAAADWDDSKSLSKAEFDGWFDLQEQIAKAHVLLTVLDHGTGLFEVLDADHDGGLSVRELRGAWASLTVAGCVTDGKFVRAKLPRHLFACVSRGHPVAPLGKPVRLGPAWFTAMDRNGDGDVSRREFTGPAAAFGTLDLDKDGLLNAEEAEKAGVKK